MLGVPSQSTPAKALRDFPLILGAGVAEQGSFSASPNRDTRKMPDDSAPPPRDRRRCVIVEGEIDLDDSITAATVRDDKHRPAVR
ncbi:MAG: hypothetical protein AAF371_20180 [Pseudomonadota bacterium]